MPDWLLPYQPSVLVLGAYGFLSLLQLLVADVVAIRRSHEPGTAVTGGHDDFLFRATRAHGNTNETLASVALIAGFSIAVGAAPAFVNGGLGAFLGFRLLHMTAYYLDLRLLRSVAFGLGLVAVLVVFAAGLGSL